jgi:hypothetical protein
VSRAFNHVGLLAVEMFQTEDDDILVNEVAPQASQQRALFYRSKLHIAV